MRLILGRSGSGKTTFCMNEVKKFDAEAFSKPLLYIVPEQFSFEVEKELINVLGKKGIINAQVLSFKRLAYKLFAEKGLKEKSLSSSGKAMLIYSIMLKHEDELKVLRNISKNIGLLDTVVEQIEELKRYNIPPELLNNLKINDEFLKRKMSDIYLIYNEYQKCIKDIYMDGNDELSILSNLLKEPLSIDGAKVWIDGFDGFIPQELVIIKELEKKCDVTVSLIYAEDELFELNKKTLEKLEKIAKINEKIILEGTKKFSSSELKHLEENYLRFPFNKYNNSINDIHLIENKNTQTEVEYVASIINKLVRENGYRYEDIAVLTRDVTNYKNLFQSIFGLNNIPYFIDDKRELYSHPIVSLVLSLFEICTRNYSYESIFGYLKTGLSNIQDEDDIDIIENYVLKYGIKGSEWQKEWQAEDARLDQINSIRVQIINPIISFKQNLNIKKTAKDIVKALYDFLISTNVYNNIQNRIDKLKQDGNLSMASEYTQVWNILMNIFDEMVSSLDDEKISFEKFMNILKIGISNHKIGIIPPSKDQVIIGDIERTRSNHIKILFVIGLNDGAFPKIFTNEGFINDKERELLLENGVEIAKDTKKLITEEYFNIYKALSVASKELYLSYPIATYEGKALRPSFIIQQIKNIFPNLNCESKVLDNDIGLISKYGSLSHLLQNIRTYIDTKKIDVKWKDTYIWYDKNDNKILHDICKAIDYKNTIEYIDSSLTNKLYNKTIYSSVSQLEKYSNCPFSYYLKYGLNAKIRNIYRIETPDLGSFIHAVIEAFSTYLLDNNISWRELTDETIDEIINNVIDDSLKSFKHNLLNSSTRMKQLTIKLKRLVKRMVLIISMQIKSGEFEIAGSEVEFGTNKNYPAIEISLSDGNKLVLNGKVDRIDIAKTDDGNYLRIIDYKSSSKQIKLSDVYYGLQLQLLTYLDAVCDDNVIPGGVLYLELNDPIINSNRELTTEEIENGIMKQLRMKGLVLSDARLIRAMDSNMQTESNVLNLSIKKDGNYTKMPVATEKQLENLRRYIKYILKQIAEEIISGNVKNEPVKRKNKTPCDYCEYKLICQFDKKLGNSFKNIKELSDDEVWARIER